MPRVRTQRSPGRMVERVGKTKRFPSDLTDEKWERIAPLTPGPGRRNPSAAEVVRRKGVDDRKLTRDLMDRAQATARFLEDEPGDEPVGVVQE